MPKLSDETLERNRAGIERAALGCFLKSGFASANMRQVARASRTSLSNVYNYYRSKDVLYLKILQSLSARYLSDQGELVEYLRTNDFPEDVGRLASAVSSILKRHESFFKLCMLDAIEFSAKNVSPVFSGIEAKIASALTEAERKPIKGRSFSKAFAITALYLSFYDFFILREHYKAKGIFQARDDREALAMLAELFTKGVR
jgi:AcrR family transcriptional regulator